MHLYITHTRVYCASSRDFIFFSRHSLLLIRSFSLFFVFYRSISKRWFRLNLLYSQISSRKHRLLFTRDSLSRLFATKLLLSQLIAAYSNERIYFSLAGSIKIRKRSVKKKSRSRSVRPTFDKKTNSSSRRAGSYSPLFLRFEYPVV